jgi:general secretion pathway protein F
LALSKSPRFEIRAIGPRREIVALDLEAANEASAIEAAKKRGFSVLSVRRHGFSLARPARPSAFPVTLFSIELKSLLEAGLSLVEALTTLSEKETQGERQRVLGGMLEAIRRGESFSQAVAHFSGDFSPLYIATLKASEQTGNLREALGRYIAYQEELDRVRKKIVSASIYPVILMAVGSLVIAFLMFYVVPRFAGIYEDFSGQLPFFSAALLALGRLIRQHAALIALCGGGLLVLTVYAASRASVRARLNEALWRIPAVGGRMKVYQLARLYRTTGMLLRAGIPVVQALDMVRDLLSARLRPQLVRARALIEQGQPMSAALGTAGLATSVAARMMLVGERSGEMGDMMAQIARFHDEEMSRFVDWFTRAFEPLLMAVLGLAIGAVVVLMYMPIFELAGSIQ